MMQDSYYDYTVEFLQSSLEIVSDNLVYGFDNINNLIKEYDFIKFPMVEAGPDSVSDKDSGNGGGNGGGSC
jgi:hypothetical protein